MTRVPLARWNRAKPLTLEDIRGWPAISYLRFSSGPQEKGDSIERQKRTLAAAIRDLGLILDRALEDRAKSASKGHHRTRGELGDLLQAIEEGAVPPQTMLVVEAVDRLTREGVLDVYPMLGTIIRNGIVLLICSDDYEYELYDEHAINGRGGEKLHSDIRAAYKYTKKLAQRAESAHQRRRERAARGEKVTPNGKPPGWITRVQLGPRLYDHLLNAHAKTMQRIFEMAESGKSNRQIAAALNGESVPTMGDDESAVWMAPRIGKILRDDAVIGYYTPMQWEDGKRKSVGMPALIYPPAISLTLWQSVQDILNQTKNVQRGATGKAVPNLFSGRCFCRTCGSTLRLDTGGGVRNGQRKKHLLCARYMHANACSDGTRYDLHRFEQPLLMAIIELARFAPKAKSKRGDANKRHDALKAKIDLHNKSIAALAPSAHAPAVAHQVHRMAAEVLDWEKELVALAIEVQAGERSTTRWEDTWRMFRETLGPALRGDVDARERLRGLLAAVDYKVVGNGLGALEVHHAGKMLVVDLADVQRDVLPGTTHENASDLGVTDA